MIDVAGDEKAEELIGSQIFDLRQQKQDCLSESAGRDDLRMRMKDMIRFLDEQPTALTEYDDAIARRLIEKITIYDGKIVLKIKSSLEMEVEG